MERGADVIRIPSGNQRSAPLSSYVERLAEADGWKLSRGSSPRHLIRLEERLNGPSFSSDDEMERHVLQKAWDGSALHESAILSLVRDDPEGGMQASYVCASKMFVQERSEDVRERSDPAHEVRVTEKLTGPEAIDIKTGWSEIAADVISRISPNPGESAPSASSRTEAALRFAKDAYLVMIDHGQSVSQAISDIRERSTIAGFMRRLEPDAPSPSF